MPNVVVSFLLWLGGSRLDSGVLNSQAPKATNMGNVGVYVSCFGWLPGREPRAQGGDVRGCISSAGGFQAQSRSQNKKSRGPRFLILVVSSIQVLRLRHWEEANIRQHVAGYGYFFNFGWFPGPVSFSAVPKLASCHCVAMCWRLHVNTKV